MQTAQRAGHPAVASVRPAHGAGAAMGGPKEEGYASAAGRGRRSSSERAAVVAEVEAGVIANVLACDGQWCHVSVGCFFVAISSRRNCGASTREKW